MVPRILIVDDDPDMVQLLQLALAEEGYSVRSASTGPEALLKARRSPPDLVVLDLLLPGINGFSVCEQLRRNSDTASVLVLMITVLPGEFPRLVGAEAGANAYLNKPFRVEELVGLVGELVRGRERGGRIPAVSPQPPAEVPIPLFPLGSTLPTLHVPLRAKA